MVRAGVVNHSSEWPFGGYNEIQGPKKKMGIAAKGRKRINGGDSYQLRESQIIYGAHLGAKDINIEGENTYDWD